MDVTRIIRYLITGAITVITLLTVLYLLRDVLGVWYLLSSVIAFLVTWIVSFVLQKFWVFNSKGLIEVKAQMGKYVVLSVFNLSANTALMYLFVEKLLLNHLIAQTIIAGLIACWGFFMYLKVVFK